MFGCLKFVKLALCLFKSRIRGRCFLVFFCKQMLVLHFFSEKNDLKSCPAKHCASSFWNHFAKSQHRNNSRHELPAVGRHKFSVTQTSFYIALQRLLNSLVLLVVLCRSVDYYEVHNAQLNFQQQILTVSFFNSSDTYCLSGKVREERVWTGALPHSIS